MFSLASALEEQSLELPEDSRNLILTSRSLVLILTAVSLLSLKNSTPTRSHTTSKVSAMTSSLSLWTDLSSMDGSRQTILNHSESHETLFPRKECSVDRVLDQSSRAWSSISSKTDSTKMQT